MMVTTFQNAPLVELVAELRWTPPLSIATDHGGKQVHLPQSLIEPSEVEGFFHRFGGAVYQQGFRRMERLIPHGAPLPPDHVVCRYRQDDEKDKPVLVQVGPAVFSTNALPPYKTWDEFRPWIEGAVDALLEARPDLGSLRASVRYIDAFREPVLGGQSVSEFFESLGFALSLPSALTRRKRSGEKIGSSIQVTIPLDGMQMTVVLRESKQGGASVGIMDTLVTVSGDVDPEKEQILGALDRARQTIHDSFFDLVEPIRELLKPVQRGDGDA